MRKAEEKQALSDDGSEEAMLSWRQMSCIWWVRAALTGGVLSAGSDGRQHAKPDNASWVSHAAGIYTAFARTPQANTDIPGDSYNHAVHAEHLHGVSTAVRAVHHPAHCFARMSTAQSAASCRRAGTQPAAAYRCPARGRCGALRAGRASRSRQSARSPGCWPPPGPSRAPSPHSHGASCLTG
jgi:hypothetical protein